MPSPVAKPIIVKGDTVVLRRGREKGKRGTVKAVFPKEGTATVEGLNVVKRHAKQGVDGAKTAGIYDKEAPIPICALQIVDPKTNLPTRVRRVRNDAGDVVRVSVRSGEDLLVPEKGR
ncbi:MAG: 50S ribosomal protein L24 [Candidatus Eremiobacteraeota bacterium]|nr:50S ribosomal protein L24 [Candidatus Eremiobacteraeota bacterium]